MSNNTVKTSKGTILPLMSLKGKPYMMVAHRVVWFNEEVANYSIETEYLVQNEDRALCKAVVSIFDKEGKLLKKAPGTKGESKKDFGDFVEKAETGAIGRAITMLGYGTAYAIADLDEGGRIIDSPVIDTRQTTIPVKSFEGEVTNVPTNPTPMQMNEAKPASFRKQKPAEVKVSNGGGWS